MDRVRLLGCRCGGLITGSVLLLGPGAGGAADTGPQLLQAIGRSVQDVDLRWNAGHGRRLWHHHLARSLHRWRRCAARRAP